MKKSAKFSPEVIDRAVRMVLEAKEQYPSQWAATESIAGKIGCTAETLRRWVRQAERDQGLREGLTTDEAQRIKELEREVKELRRANEILKLASAFFAQAELDRRLKSRRRVCLYTRCSVSQQEFESTRTRRGMNGRIANNDTSHDCGSGVIATR